MLAREFLTVRRRSTASKLVERPIKESHRVLHFETVRSFGQKRDTFQALLKTQMVSQHGWEYETICKKLFEIPVILRAARVSSGSSSLSLSSL